jgi:hypothetical protein
VYPTAEYNVRSGATWFDTVTVTGLPAVYDLTFEFDLDGSWGSHDVGLWSTVMFSLEMWTPGSVPDPGFPFPDMGSYSFQTWNGASDISESLVFGFGGRTATSWDMYVSLHVLTNIQALAEADVPTMGDVLINGSGSAQFGNTLTLKSLLFRAII